jgi:hypothetical protein
MAKFMYHVVGRAPEAKGFPDWKVQSYLNFDEAEAHATMLNVFLSRLVERCGDDGALKERVFRQLADAHPFDRLYCEGASYVVRSEEFYPHFRTYESIDAAVSALLAGATPDEVSKAAEEALGEEVPIDWHGWNCGMEGCSGCISPRVKRCLRCDVSRPPAPQYGRWPRGDE